MREYLVNEIFGPTLQGEGARAGIANLWLRFGACNLACSADGDAGFDCDTNFAGGEMLSADEIAARLKAIAGPVLSVVISGGEPSLQVDETLIDTLRSEGFYLAIETNGTRPLPHGIDWISCSPKTAEHTLRISRADELRYVRAVGQSIPRPSIEAEHRFLSPAFEPDGSLRRDTLEHCIGLVLANPSWRLSVQMHRLWRLR